MEIQRLVSGVGGFESNNGLDDILGGGVPAGNVVLVSGEPGTGKSILSMQFLMAGVKEGEKCLYLSFEQPESDIIKNMSLFNWDIQKALDGGFLKIKSYDITEDDPKELYDDFTKLIGEYKPQRVVIDSLTTFVIHLEALDYLKNPKIIMRRVVAALISYLRKQDVTAFLISEVEDEKNRVSSYYADGIILMNFIAIGAEEFGTLQVRKMRNTKHAHNPYMTYITDEGISVGEETVGIIK